VNAYVLNFDTGEYTDRTNRTVCVYNDLALAEAHCALANGWLKDRDMHFEEPPKRYWERDFRGLKCPYDPDLDFVDYTGAGYSVVEVVYGCEQSLARMRAFADGVPDYGYADWVEDYGWSKEANKFRATPKETKQ
jgi:hypothetical protein